MKIKISAIMLTILIGLCFATNFDGYDQVSEKVELKEKVKKYENRIDKWENKANILIVLTIVVFGLGIVTVILKSYDKKWCKHIIIISGAAISVITYINNIAFDHDHRTFLSKAAQAHHLTNDAYTEIIRGYPPDNLEARDEWFNKIQKIFHQIDKIESTLYPQTKKSEHIADKKSINYEGSSINLISTAYAQSQQRIVKEPSWLSKPPTHVIDIYFVGIGENPSIKEAKKNSLNNAVNEATRYLRIRLYTFNPKRPHIELLADYLVTSGEIEDTYFRYDQDKKSYRFYTLFKLNKRIAETDIELFAIRNRIYIPNELKQVVEITQEFYEKYYSRRMSDYEKFLYLAAETLSPEQHDRFMEGYQLRKDGRYDEAIHIFEQAIEENPAFYLGWYNLALAYDDLKDFSRAKQAYEKAAELEPQQPMRDASFYNSYGFFLYRNKKYKEAIAQLKKAIKIDADHPEAKQTLKAAQKAIQ